MSPFNLLWRRLHGGPSICQLPESIVSDYEQLAKPPKRNRNGTLLGLLKPERATTYDGLTLRMLMTGMPLTVKTLTRFMEAQLGNRTPNDVGASIRRVKRHLRGSGIRLHECDVNPDRGARHKKHWLDPDQIRTLQGMGR